MASKVFSRSSNKRRGVGVCGALLFFVAFLAFGDMRLTATGQAFGAEDAPLVLVSPVLRLSWEASSLATKFRIEINTRPDWDPQGRFALFEDFGPTTYLRIGPFLPNEAVYYWRVWAGNAAGWSPPANGGRGSSLMAWSPSFKVFQSHVDYSRQVKVLKQDEQQQRLRFSPGDHHPGS